MRTRKRGVTIMELLVATFICSVLLSAMLMFFLSSQRLYGKSSASNSLGRDARVAVEYLQRDLEETTLACVRSYVQPHKSETGLAMVSARDPQDTAAFPVSNFGTPLWQSHVFYFVEPEEDPRTSSLIRTIVGLPERERGWAVPPPSLIPGNAVQRRVVLRGLISPAYTIRTLEHTYELVESTGPGGFIPTFLRVDDTGAKVLSSENPSAHTDKDRPGWTRGSTGLIRVELALVNWTAKGELNYLNTHLLVAPAN